jgi:hypothetical protein
MEILILVVWLGGAIAVGYAAAQRGRGDVAWFLLAVILSPLLAVLILLACPAEERAPRSVPEAAGDSAWTRGISLARLTLAVGLVAVVIVFILRFALR